MAGLLGMLPGVGRQIKNMKVDERQFDRVEAIILSMTPQERRNPQLIDGSPPAPDRGRQRHQRAAVNQLLGQFKQMQRMMKQVGRRLTDACSFRDTATEVTWQSRSA